MAADATDINELYAQLPPPEPGTKVDLGTPATPGTNQLALLALILGVIGLSLFAIIAAHFALNQIKKTGESGRGLAIAGAVFGFVWMIGALALVVV